MTRDEHKEMFQLVEEMFWGKETKLIAVVGLDPDDHYVALTGPDTNPVEVIMTFKKVMEPILAKLEEKNE